jgi:hypothetical protein
MPIQVHGVLLHTMSGTELSRVRTEFDPVCIFPTARHIQYNRTPSLRAMANAAGSHLHLPTNMGWRPVQTWSVT